MTSKQICQQCGHCCERWGWGQKGTVDDLIPWFQHERRDILQYVAVCLDSARTVNGSDIAAGDIPHIKKVRFWYDTSGRMLRYCPFLGRTQDRKAFCRIHDVRPAVCREYAPWNCSDSEYQNVRCQACREMTP